MQSEEEKPLVAIPQEKVVKLQNTAFQKNYVQKRSKSKLETIKRLHNAQFQNEMEQYMNNISDELKRLAKSPQRRVQSNLEDELAFIENQKKKILIKVNRNLKNKKQTPVQAAAPSPKNHIKSPTSQPIANLPASPDKILTPPTLPKKISNSTGQKDKRKKKLISSHPYTISDNFGSAENDPANANNNNNGIISQSLDKNPTSESNQTSDKLPKDGNKTPRLSNLEVPRRKSPQSLSPRLRRFSALPFDIRTPRIGLPPGFVSPKGGGGSENRAPATIVEILEGQFAGDDDEMILIQEPDDETQTAPPDLLENEELNAEMVAEENVVIDNKSPKEEEKLKSSTEQVSSINPNDKTISLDEIGLISPTSKIENLSHSVDSNKDNIAKSIERALMIKKHSRKPSGDANINKISNQIGLISPNSLDKPLAESDSDTVSPTMEKQVEQLNDEAAVLFSPTNLQKVEAAFTQKIAAAAAQPEKDGPSTDQYKQKLAGGEANILVAVRVRPLLKKEQLRKVRETVTVLDEKLIVVLDPIVEPSDILRINRTREKRFAFDYSFHEKTTQQEVFQKTVMFLLESAIYGYNSTVFAYGATGSGKTFTMLGTEETPGISALALTHLFGLINQKRSEMEFDIKLSYMEIYNENIRDLLNRPIAPTQVNPNSSNDNLDIREDSSGIRVVGITEIQVDSVEDVIKLLYMGNKRRTQEPTSQNKESSRSHAVLQLVIEQRSKIKDIEEQVKIGKLSLIDLAGSERASVSKNTGQRLLEGANINKSLLALGNVINALVAASNSTSATSGSENGVTASSANAYIPYRDSKLTRLLKDSLGGNCRTVMIACISPGEDQIEETINTLKYADRAKRIKTNLSRNVLNVQHHLVEYQKIIQDLRSEISFLKKKYHEDAVWNQLKESQQNGGANGGEAGAGNRQNSAQKRRRKEKIRDWVQQIKSALEYNFNQQIDIINQLHSLNIYELDRRKKLVIEGKINLQTVMGGFESKEEKNLKKQSQKKLENLLSECENQFNELKSKLESEKVVPGTPKYLIRVKEPVEALVKFYESEKSKTGLENEKKLMCLEMELQQLELAHLRTLLSGQIQDNGKPLTFLSNQEKNAALGRNHTVLERRMPSPERGSKNESSVPMLPLLMKDDKKNSNGPKKHIVNQSVGGEEKRANSELKLIPLPRKVSMEKSPLRDMNNYPKKSMSPSSKRVPKQTNEHFPLLPQNSQPQINSNHANNANDPKGKQKIKK